MNRRAFLKNCSYTLTGLWAGTINPCTAKASLVKKPNVLFIAVDDWNDWVGGMGHNLAKTPNLDRLAKRGMLFCNAHCAAPICNPSRASIMSGQRPSTTGVYNNAQPLYHAAPDTKSIPRYFRDNGYHVEGGGKIYHEAIGYNRPSDWDHFFLWNEDQRDKGWWGKYSWPPIPQPDPRPAQKITKHTKRNFDWAALDEPDELMPDHMVASWACNFLKKKQNKPFFLACGMFRPHIPWFMNKKWFELYDLDKIETPPYLKNDVDDLPPIAKKWAQDRHSRHDLIQEYGLWKKAIRAYLACISFSDAQVGRVLEALEASDYADNTIIVLFSDHGYHLGEKDHWHKFTLWERSTRVPLIVVAPGVTEPSSKCDEPVSLLDIYPSLVDLCDLPAKGELEGKSFKPLLENPNAKWDHAAVTTLYKNNHAVRTKNWRYIQYNDGTEELYDHHSDPNEWHNLASDKQYDKVKAAHKKWIPEINKDEALHKTSDLVFDPKTYTWSKKAKENQNEK